MTTNDNNSTEGVGKGKTFVTFKTNEEGESPLLSIDDNIYKVSWEQSHNCIQEVFEHRKERGE